MKAVLNRGNLILGLAWAMAIATFVNRAGKVDAQAGGAKAQPRGHAAQVTVNAPSAGEAPVEVSRNDSPRPLQ